MVQREGGKWYSQLITTLSGFLTSQGVPQQYVVMATQGVVALLVVAAIVITFSIIAAVCGCLASNLLRLGTQARADADSEEEGEEGSLAAQGAAAAGAARRAGIREQEAVQQWTEHRLSAVGADTRPACTTIALGADCSSCCFSARMP